MKKFTLSCAILLLGWGLLSAQMQNADVEKYPDMFQNNQRRLIRIPDVEGLKTLKCDFHVHTFFSDGQVSPSIRIDEAWSNGLDVIAITDHLEYRPNNAWLKNEDHNMSYELAKKRADQIGFLLIKGTEITKSKPFGHMNALFISDANPILKKEGAEALEEAIKQNAFVMWNHPGWPDNKSTLTPQHEQWIKEKKIHGIEMFNEQEFYPKALGYAVKYNIAPMGCTDVHGLIGLDYGSNLRPMTLVFAQTKNETELRKAMFDRQTATLYNNQLAGSERWLKPLMLACLTIRKIDDKGLCEISNDSDISFRMAEGDRIVTLPARTVVRTTISEKNTFVVTNVWIDEQRNMTISGKDLLSKYE